MKSRFELKMDAKTKIKTARPSPYPATMIYLLLTIVISALNNILSGQRGWAWLAERYSMNYPVYPRISLYGAVFLALLSIVSTFISVGYQWFALKISRSRPANTLDLFETFNMPLKVIGLSIMTGVFVFLWSLLLMVPGIIAMYRYRQAFFILCDHPDYGVMQCIRESKAMMRGYKWDLFALDLSFLGWVILSALTLCILFIWTMPYIYVTHANFYNALLGLKAQGSGEIL